MILRSSPQPYKKILNYKHRLLVYFLLFSIVPVLVVGLFSANVSSRIIQQEVNNNQQMTLQQLKYQVDTFLYNIERTSLQFAGDITIEKSLKVGFSMKDPIALDAMLDMLERVNNYRSYSDINFNVSIIYNKYGYLYSNKYGMMNIKDSPYYQLLQAEKPPKSGSIIIPPNVYKNQNELLLIRSIQSSAAPAEGLLVMEADARRFYEFFRSLEIGNNSRVVIVSDEGRVAMSQKESEIGSRIDSSSPLFRIWQDPQLSQTKVDVEGVDYKISVQKSSFNQWTYIAMTPLHILTKKSDSIKRITWAVVIVLVIIWTLLSFLGSRRMFFPLKRMSLKLPELKQNGDVLQAIDAYIDHAAEMNRHLTDQINNQKSDVRNHLLLQLLRGEISDKEFRNKSKHFKFPQNSRWFYVGLAEIDQYIAFKEKYVGLDRNLMMYALSKMIEEIGDENYSCAAVSHFQGQVAFILGVDEVGENTDYRINELCDAIRSKVSQYFQISLTVAVSEVYQNMNSISDGYDQAQSLLHLRFWLGDGRTISSTNLEDLEHVQKTSKNLVKWQKSIVKSIAEGDLEKAEKQLGEMIDAMPQTEAHSQLIVGIFAHLIGEVEDMMEERGHELNRMFEDSIYKRLYSSESLAELRGWIQGEFFPVLRKYHGQINGSKTKELVQKVIAYIGGRFDTDLSLQQVADHFGLPSYQLSRYFKEETGLNFVDYVMQLRISKAKEWLTYSEMPIKEITERLRYATTQNFTRVFKQITGVPPGKYRSDGKQDNK